MSIPPIQIPKDCLEQIELISSLRRVWAQHVWWTRLFILDIVNHLGYSDLLYDRLIRNASDVADVIRPYYSQEIVDKLQELLESYVEVKSRVLYNIAAGNTYAANVEKKRWFENADELAELAYQLSPVLLPSHTKPYVYSLIEMTISQLENMMLEQIEKDILSFDRVEAGTYAFADYLSSGIIDQLNIDR